jgi:hypothetical protein
VILIDTLCFDAISMGAPANPDYIMTFPRYVCLDIADFNIPHETRLRQVLAGIELPQWIVDKRSTEFKTDQAMTTSTRRRPTKQYGSSLPTS